MHNVGVMWLTSAAKGSKIPNQLDRAKVTAPQAMRAMEQSREALSVVLGRAITADGHVKGFRPDAIGFLAYLIAHDAHHRGQITMLARQLGYPLPQKVVFGMWDGIRADGGVADVFCLTKAWKASQRSGRGLSE
jgi:uncharacterized damage-inducible protein DinB